MSHNGEIPLNNTGIFSDNSDSLFNAVFDRIQTGILIIDPVIRI